MYNQDYAIPSQGTNHPLQSSIKYDNVIITSKSDPAFVDNPAYSTSSGPPLNDNPSYIVMKGGPGTTVFISLQ